MKIQITAFRTNKRVQSMLASGLLLLMAFSYCLYQFYQVKKYRQQQEVLTGQINKMVLLQSRLPANAVTPALLHEFLRKSAQENQIPLTSLSKNQQGVQVVLSAVPFSHLTLWLAKLQREQGIRVVQLAVERGQQKPGMVTVNKLLLTAQPLFL